jgi:hypothetical protein
LCESYLAHLGSFQTSWCSSKCPLAKWHSPTRPEARLKAALLGQAHSTCLNAYKNAIPLSRAFSRRLNALVSSISLSKSLSRRVGSCISAILLG